MHVIGNAIIKAYGVVCQTVGSLFAAVPAAVGAAVAACANAVLAGVERLINRVSGTLNGWIAKVNDTLGMLPDWMGPDWARVPTIPGDVSFGRYENPYADDLAGRWQDYTGAVGGIVRSDPLGDVFRDVSARADPRRAVDARDDPAGTRARAWWRRPRRRAPRPPGDSGQDVRAAAPVAARPCDAGALPPAIAASAALPSRPMAERSAFSRSPPTAASRTDTLRFHHRGSSSR